MNNEMNAALRRVLKRLHYPLDVMLLCVRWYMAYPLSLRNLEAHQAKYLNNVVEQDHRAIKRRTRPLMCFKDFRCARILPGGIELMHMIAKRQMQTDGLNQTPTDQFYSLCK